MVIRGWMVGAIYDQTGSYQLGPEQALGESCAFAPDSTSKQSRSERMRRADSR
jgi:hypothetical protein